VSDLPTLPCDFHTWVDATSQLRAASCELHYSSEMGGWVPVYQLLDESMPEPNALLPALVLLGLLWWRRG